MFLPVAWVTSILRRRDRLFNFNREVATARRKGAKRKRRRRGDPSERPCMFKTPSTRSTTARRRARVAASAASRHAGATTAGPRPIALGPTAAAAKLGPSRPRRAHSPGQPTEPLPTPAPARSHSQGRDARMTTADTTSSPPSDDELFVGIDVAKDTLDVARGDADAGPVHTVANDPPGIARLVAALRDARPAPATVVVVEATGGLERPLVDALLEAGVPVALVNPGRVRHLARALGVCAKTDRLDARVLARFARLARPRLCERRGANRAELEALVTCRRQLLHARTEQDRKSV